jgi:hypothetical protein
MFNWAGKGGVCMDPNLCLGDLGHDPRKVVDGT